MKYVKKVIVAVIVLFCLFYLISRPEDAAAAVRGAVDAVVGAVQSLFTFLASLAD